MIEEIISFLISHGGEIAIVLVAGYLFGSINCAILVTNMYSHTDIRKYGSGNAGTTNVMRSVGKKAGYMTFVGDLLKGIISVLFGMFIFLMMDSAGSFSQVFDASLYGSAEWKLGGYFGGFACVMGHLFPLYHDFRGGKGVVTAVSIMLATDWRVVAILAVVFFGLFAIFKIISLSSIISAASYPIVHILLLLLIDRKGVPDDYTFVYFAVSTALVVIVSLSIIIKHHENIARLINGTEKKFTIKKEG